MRPLRKPAVALSCLGILVGAANAQIDPPFNAKSVSKFDEAGSVYSDIWAQNDIAYIARLFQSEIDIVDVSDRRNPVKLATYDVNGADNNASTQDVKAANGLMFIALDLSQANAVQIVDVRDPSNPQLLTTINPDPGPYEPAHNLWYADGFLYIASQADNTLAILDLTSYDPDNAPPTIDNWDFLLTGVGTDYVHDMNVINGRLYVSAWSSLEIFDVTGLPAVPPVHVDTILGYNVHSSWSTPNHQFILMAEERPRGALRLFEATRVMGSIEYVQRDSFALTPDITFSIHSPLLVDDRIYLSAYQAGVYVLELDRLTATMEVVASFDTSSRVTVDFEGCWGVFPYLGPEKILTSDIDKGLKVLDIRGLGFEFPAGLPEELTPLVPTTFPVQVVGHGRTADLDTAFLSWQVEDGPIVGTLMTDLGNGLLEATLPGFACGARVDFWVAADDNGRNYYQDPARIGDTHTAYVTSGLVPVFEDGFETDLGWTVTSDPGLAGGEWTRDDPVGNCIQAETGDPDGAGQACFFTGQGTVGGAIGEADVDGGPTWLTSPTLDLAGIDAVISYSRWHYNDLVDGDTLLVEITNDAGQSWTPVEDILAEAGGWVRHAFRVSDMVAPSSQVQVRFRSQDTVSASFVESGVDEFRVDRLACDPAASALTRNGSGANSTGYQSVGVPALGTTWTTVIDLVPDNALVSLMAISANGPEMIPISIGELLIGLPILGTLNSTGMHELDIPMDVSLLGLELFTQGVTVGFNGLRLQNAIDATVGF